MPHSTKTKKKTKAKAKKSGGGSGDLHDAVTKKKRAKLTFAVRKSVQLKNLALQRRLAKKFGHTGLTNSAVKSWLKTKGAARKLHSEAMGESGAAVFLKWRTGRSTIGLAYPDASHPFSYGFGDGTAWPSAVAFNGAGVADVTYWDGKTLYVIEAKGGASQLSDKRQQEFDPETGARLTGKKSKGYGGAKRIAQGSILYLTDIGHKMASSSHADGRSAVGYAILSAISNNRIEYIAVSTSVPVGGTKADVSVMG